MMRSRTPSLLLAAALGITSLAACTKTTSTSTPATAAATSASFPVTLHPTNGPVKLSTRPARIVSLSPALTEDLFAVGAGPQVVAVDSESNYPAGVPKSTLSGFTPNLEAIAGYKPDLVVTSFDTKGLVAGLTGLGIPTLLEPAANTLDDAYAEITEMGTATGHPGEAAKTNQDIKGRIQTLVASVAKPSTPLSYYYELDPMRDTLTSHTFVGSLFALLGMRNIADPADSATSHYPQISAETLVVANPDFIFLADTKCCGQNPSTVATRAGFSTITAVKKNHVVGLEDDIASRWGPRVTDLLAAIVNAVKAGPPSPTP